MHLQPPDAPRRGQGQRLMAKSWSSGVGVALTRSTLSCNPPFSSDKEFNLSVNFAETRVFLQSISQIGPF